MAHAATASVTTWDQLRTAMSDTTVDTIQLAANVQRTAGATTAATDLPTVGRDLTIDGQGYSLDFRAGGATTAIARAGILLTANSTATFTLTNIDIIRPNGGIYSLISYAATAASNVTGTTPANSTLNWTVNVSEVSTSVPPSSGFITLPGGTVNITKNVTWDSSLGSNPATVVVNARLINVTGSDTNVTLRNHTGGKNPTTQVTLFDTTADQPTVMAYVSGKTNAINVDGGAQVTIENLGQGSTQAVAMDIGTAAGTVTSFNVKDPGTVLNVFGWGSGTGVTGGTLTMQAAPTTDGSSGFTVTNGAEMHVWGKVPDNRNPGTFGMPALVQQVDGGVFKVDGEGSLLDVESDGTGNDLAGVIRIRAVGNQTLQVSNLGQITVERPPRTSGNMAAGIRFGTAQNNTFSVTTGGLVTVHNGGTGTAATNDTVQNNCGVEFANPRWTFTIDGYSTLTTGPNAGQVRPSAVQVLSDYGAAVCGYGQTYGAINLTNRGVFVAKGNVNSLSSGIFGAGGNFQFTSDNPQYYDFQNTNTTRATGNLVFDVQGSTSTFSQTNSDIAVWGNGLSRVGGTANTTNSSDNKVGGNPYRSWTLVPSLSLSGADFVNMAPTSDPNLTTDVSSFGTRGMASWRRVSGNNAPPTIRTMEPATNADLYVRATGTVAEGIDFYGRPIWDNEVFSRWSITDPNGNTTTSTAGQSSSVQTEDLYTKETGVKQLQGTVRYSDGNLLTTGTTYNLTQAWRGSTDDPTSTQIHMAAPSDILTGPVTVTDILPPEPAKTVSPMASIPIDMGEVTVTGTWSNATDQAIAQPNNPDPATKLTAVVNTADHQIADCSSGLNPDGTWTCVLPEAVVSALNTGDKVYFVLTDANGNANPLVETPMHDAMMEPAPYLTASSANIVATDFPMKAPDATAMMNKATSDRDAQLISLAHAQAVKAGDTVMVKSVDIPNPATPGVYDVTFQITGSPDDATNMVTVKATISAGDVDPGKDCNGTIVGQVYADPLEVSLDAATPSSSLSVLIADSECNAIEGAIINLTATGATTPSSTFTGNPATTGPDGIAHATITDTVAETVTIRGAYDATNATNNGVTSNSGRGNLWPSTDTPPTDVVTFTAGVVSDKKCVITDGSTQYTVQSKQVYPYPFTVDTASTEDPQEPMTTATSEAGTDMGVRTYLFDEKCNPLPGYAVEFTGTPAMQPDGTTPTTRTTHGTTNSDGMADGSVTNKKAETVNVDGTFASPDTPPTDTGDLLQGSITFTAGDADTCATLGECVCADPHDTATNLSVSRSSVQIPGTILATAHITDRYCNIVDDGFSVDFSVAPTTGQTPPAGTGTPFVGEGTTAGTTNAVTVTTVNGNATATVSDTKPEKVDVTAEFARGEIDQSPQTVEFTYGDESSENSSFTCVMTTSSADPPAMPVASGDVTKDNWNCTIILADDQHNLLPGKDVTKFVFTQTTNTATPSTPVVDNGDGSYTVKFSSTVADKDNKVTAEYNGVSIIGTATLSGTTHTTLQPNTPIPFKAGKVCTAPDCDPPICPVNGQDYVVGQVYAHPNENGTNESSSLTVLLADEQCNKIVGATVTYDKDKGGSNSAVLSGSPATTNADGLAVASVTDAKTDTITVGGTYDATNATSAGIPSTYGVGNLSSDTTSLSAADPTIVAPAATGVSMVRFSSGDVAPDTECEVTVMPENIQVTVKVAQVYSGTAPWKTDGTAQDGSSSVLANGTSSVLLRTWLLDKDCNPIPGAAATFTGTPVNTPATSVITPATATTTDSTGMAKASITDTKAETVTVGGSYTPTTHTGKDDGLLRTTTATFNAGAFDPSKSVFIVSPAVDPTSASKANWVVADGDTSYTGTLFAYDASGNPVTNMSPGDFIYTVTGVPTDPTATTQPSVKVTIGAQDGNKYYVKFTTTYAAATYTVTAASSAAPTVKVTGSNATDGTTVTTWNNGSAVTAGTGGAPIPFQAGAPTGGSDTPTQCTDGRNKSWIGVSSPSQAAGTPATVTVHLTDVNCNPVTDTLVSFSVTNQGKMSPATATTNAQGVATSDVNDFTAETVQVTANSGAAVVGPVTTVFTAGPPAVDTDCTNNAVYKTGTQLTVAPTSVQLRGSTPGSTTVDAFITDRYCNPVTFDTSVAGAHGVDVNFSVSPVFDGTGAPASTASAYLNGAAGRTAFTMQTDPTGHASTTLTDTVAETVNVKANLSATQLIKPVTGINVVFATGDFNGAMSSFTCVVTSGSATPTPVANGTDSYTCTVDAKDSTGAALPNLSTANFAFPITAGTPGTTTNLVARSTVTNVGGGIYTVKLTTTTSDSTYKVTASYAGEQVTGTTSVGGTLVPTPIPFTFGTPISPDPINPTCGDGREKTNTKAEPTTQEAGTPSVITTLVTDKDCNPVVGTTVSWGVTSNSGTAAVDSPSKTTGNDGKATTNLNDQVAEYVQVSATANGAGATNLNAGSASVTFQAGAPVPGPVTPCPTPTMTGSNVTAASPIQVGGTSTVTAKVTDRFCNPVTTAVQVTFNITSPSSTATIATTPGSTAAMTANGIATATATDNTAEIAKVTAQISQGYLYAPAGSASDVPSGFKQAPIVFQAGVFSGEKSTFVCAVTSGSATPPVADGSQSYTCTITAKDGNGNNLTTIDPTNPITPSLFEFDMSNFIDKSAVTEVSATSSPGQYTVKFTTLKSDPNYTVRASYNGYPITGSPTVAPTPIPFQSGAPIPPDTTNPKCVTGPNAGSPKTYTQAAPTTTQVGEPYSTTVGSLITTYVSDSECNPVVGATVAFTQDKHGTFTTTTAGSYTTNAVGNATAYETDHYAETTKVTSTVTYTDPTSHTVKTTAGDDGTINVTFTAGSAVDEVPGTCPDGTSGHVSGTNLTTTSPQKVDSNSTTTAYVTDRYCNPVGNVAVTFAVSPSTASLTGASPVNTGVVPSSGATTTSGKAVTTFTDSKAEVASITASIQIAGVATPIYAAAPTDPGITGWTSTKAAPSRFTEGGVDLGVCEVTVDGVRYSVQSTQVYPYPFSQDPASTLDPKAPMTTANPTVSATATQALRTYLFDANCNPIPGYAVTFADGTPASQGPAVFATTQGTTDAGGMATGTVRDTKAETVHAAGTYASPDTPPSDHGSLIPAAITFKAGAAHDGPDWKCGSTQGTTLTADTMSTQVNTYSVIQAYVTDEFCNPIDGASVNFSFTGATGLTPALHINPTGGPTPVMGSGTFVPAGSNTGVLTVGGYASVTITDAVAETINVRAVDEYIGDVQVTFTPGVVDPAMSTFQCTPHTTATAGTAPIANGNSDGSNYYTCTITAKDSNGNVVTGANLPAASSFSVTPSSSDVTATTLVAGATAGTFTTTLASKVADPSYTARAFFGTTPIGAPDVAQVPFQAGLVDTDTICDVNGQQMKVGQIYAYDLTAASPTLSTSATVKSGVTEGLKVFMADKDCNPIPGVTLAITPNPASPVVFAMVINPTGADGMATATATDTKPEKVTFSGTYTSPNNGNGNLWPGDVTWAPSAPTITGPSGTVVTDDPVISGTGSKEGDTVTVKDSNGKTYCTATVGPAPDFKWSCSRSTSTTPPDPTALPSTGTRSNPSVTATESDAAGNTSDPSAPKIIAVDKTPATISGPADGSTVVTDTPKITGAPGSAPYSADPNNPTTVDVTIPDPNDPTKTITVCTADVQPDGSWSCTPSSSTPLPNGDVTLTPVVKDATGGSNQGTPVKVKVDTTKPTITGPKVDPTTNVAQVITDKPPISGTAPYSPSPNPTTVTVTIPDPTDPTKTLTVCNAVVQSDGTWNCPPSSILTPLPSGDSVLTPTVTDAVGGSTIGVPIAVKVNTTPPSINPMKPTNNPKPKIDGKGTFPGDTITVKDANGDTICTAVVQADLTWSCTPTSPLKDGTHNVTATETDASGNHGTPSAPQAVKVDTSVPKQPTVDPTTGSTISGSADPNTKITITVDGKPVPGCTNVTTNSNGRFSCNPTTPLPAGTVVTVQAVNSLGTVSPATKVTVGAIPVTVQTGGIPASGFNAGGLAAGALGLAGILFALAGIRRRKEAPAV